MAQIQGLERRTAREHTGHIFHRRSVERLEVLYIRHAREVIEPIPRRFRRGIQHRIVQFSGRHIRAVLTVGIVITVEYTAARDALTVVIQRESSAVEYTVNLVRADEITRVRRAAVGMREGDIIGILVVVRRAVVAFQFGTAGKHRFRVVQVLEIPPVVVAVDCLEVLAVLEHTRRGLQVRKIQAVQVQGRQARTVVEQVIGILDLRGVEIREVGDKGH